MKKIKDIVCSKPISPFWKILAGLFLLFFSLPSGGSGGAWFGGAFAQQDPHYSQYMFNQLAVNPAYAGSKEAISAAVFYRNQWTGMPGAPVTETFTIHSPMRNKKAALGFSVVADKIGPKSSIGAFGSYAYRIKVRDGKLSFGLRVGVYQYNYNWDLVTHKDQTDNVYIAQGSEKETIIVPTADAGLYYYTNSMYVGLSITHLNNGLSGALTKKTAAGDYSHLSSHTFFTIGKAWAVSEKLIFNPSCMIKMAGNSALSFDQNFSFLYNHRIWMGLSLRSISGIGVYSQFNITDKFKIGYAFDFTYNDAGLAGRGSHEIMISYDIKTSKPPFFSPRYF